MPQLNISGPGLGLQPPQSLYPTSLSVPAPIPYTPSSNIVSLPAGMTLPIPAGTWIVGNGAYTVVQWLDPITGIWRGFSSARQPHQIVQSDGFTRRLANLTGCPVAAVVTTAGTTYTQAGTTVTSNAGGSTWQAIIGGLVTLTTISVAGSGYKVPPLCIMPSCPSAVANGGVPQGVPATAVAAISSGTVSTITVTNQGAGYTGSFTVTLLPDPTDPNIASITNAVAVFGITGAGTVAAVLCTNNGTAGTTNTTLSIAGGDSTAAATAVMMYTETSATVTAAGAGYGAQSVMYTTTGGVTSATATHTNPAVELTDYIPRPVQGLATGAGTLGSISTIGTIYDSGLFTGTPIGLVLGGAPTTFASITIGLGNKPDTAVLQPV